MSDEKSQTQGYMDIIKNKETYTHKGKAPEPSEKCAEDRLDFCLHTAIHIAGKACDPELSLGIEAAAIEGALDAEGNVLLKVVYVVPLKDIP